MIKSKLSIISIILLVLISFFVTTEVFAAIPSGETSINILIYKESGIHNTLIDVNFKGNYGNEIQIDLSSLVDLYEKDEAFFVYKGERIDDENNSFLVSNSTRIYAFLKNTEDVVAVYLDSNGTLLDVKYNSSPTFSGSQPTKPGYDFNGFLPNISTIEEDTLFVAQYSRSLSNQINITVNGGTKDQTSHLFNDVVTLTPNPNASDFAYWEDAEGQVISTDPNYSFSAIQDISLNAVFSNEYEKRLGIYLQDVTGIRSGKKSFLGYINNPNPLQYEVVEYGILVSEDVKYLEYGDENVTPIPSSILAPTNEFLRSIDEDVYNSVRGYVIYFDGNEQKIAYSENNFTTTKIYVPVNFEENLKVLAIGNSYTVDSMEFLYQIAEDYGVENIVLGNLFIPGESLEGHALHATLNEKSYFYAKNSAGSWSESVGLSIADALADERWDVIVVQQSPWDAGLPNTYNPHLTTLINHINENKQNPYADVLFHLIWAYQTNTSREDYINFGYNQMNMYNAIVSSYNDEVATNELVDGMIPTGTAIQNIRTSFIQDNLTIDGFHLSHNEGRLAAAYTWFASITKLSIVDVDYRAENVTEEELLAIKDGVNKAIENPLIVSQSDYNITHVELNPYLNYVNGYWDFSIDSNVATPSAFHVTHKVPINKSTLKPGSIITVEPGYKYRLDFYFNYFGIYEYTTNWITTPELVIDENFYYHAPHNYDYIGITITTIDEDIDLSEQVADVSNKVKIKAIGDMAWIAGFWFGGGTEMHQNDFYFLSLGSTILDRHNLDVGTTVTVAEPYKVSIVFFIVGENGKLAAFTTYAGLTGTVTLDTAKWESYKYVAFYIEHTSDDFFTKIIQGHVSQIPTILTFTQPM